MGYRSNIISRNKFHPSGRIIILERECDWKSILNKLENDLKIPGMIYYVITVEIFSGKFKLECVENDNKYLINGYVSTFFEDVNIPIKKGKTTNTFNHLSSLKEAKTEESKSEDEEQFSIEYVGDGSVSPPIPVSPGKSSTKSSDIPNVRPSPPVLSKKNSKAVLTLTDNTKKQFSIEKTYSQDKMNEKLASHEEFDDFFGNIDDVVFCYNAENKGKKEGEEHGKKESKEEKEKLNIYKKETINYKVKKDSSEKINLLVSPKSVTTELSKMKYEKFFRKNLPISLMGKKEEEIEKITNIKDVIFVNKTGNIACGYTLKSIIALAEYSIYN